MEEFIGHGIIGGVCGVTLAAAWTFFYLRHLRRKDKIDAASTEVEVHRLARVEDKSRRDEIDELLEQHTVDTLKIAALEAKLTTLEVRLNDLQRALDAILKGANCPVLKAIAS
jgi:hypothetical protein